MVSERSSFVTPASSSVAPDAKEAAPEDKLSNPDDKEEAPEDSADIAVTRVYPVSESCVSIVCKTPESASDAPCALY